MAALMYLATDDGEIEIPRQFNDDGSPCPPCTWAVQLWGTPPGESVQRVVSLPYHATGDIHRVRAAAERLLPHWQFEIREVWVARAITHDDAVALFRRWGW